MNLKSFPFLLFSLLFTLASPAQVLEFQAAENRVPGAEKIRLKDHLLAPNYLRFHPGREIPVNQFEGYFKEAFALNATPHGLRYQREEQGVLGHTHRRYQQTYAGYPVEGSMIISHAAAGRIYAFNGDFFDLGQPATQALLSEETALQQALAQIGAEAYMWEPSSREGTFFGGQIRESLSQAAHQPYYPKGELVIVPKDGNFKTGPYHLAWKFDIATREPLGQSWTYVDARQGRVICQFDRLFSADSTGVAVTRYSGSRPIVADWFDGQFRLRESGRGNGIETYNANFSPAEDFVDDDNIWNNANADLDEVAGDAHWGAEMTYDYLQQKFGRNSINDNGYQIRNLVHVGNNFFNAFWNGQANYGDGNGNPLTTLDICGHEICHGLTNFTAGLIYRNESGALNESFSDIFGKAIEFFARPGNFSWRVGGDLGTGIRDMRTPGIFRNPRNYLGNNWYTGSGDNGGVHINSGVQNFWFVLLVEGGNGTNDFGDPYQVASMSIDTASAVAYRNLSVYLTPSSDYEDARFYAIQSAIDLYGPCGKIHQAVTNAWHAVGVGQPYSPNPISSFSPSSTDICNYPYTVRFFDESSGASSYYWDFGDGTLSNQPNPIHTYSSPGTYSVKLRIIGICGGQDSVIQTNLITVNAAPSKPLLQAAPQVACQGQARLVASAMGADEVRWFDQNGNLVAVGDTFLTPPQGQANTYIARAFDKRPRQYVGAPDSTIGTGGYLSTDKTSVVFSVMRPVILESVKVYAQYPYQRIIEYRNSTGVVLARRPVFIPAGESRIPLNLSLERGAEQQLGLVVVPGLYGNNSNLNYPYTLPGVLSIDGTTGSNPQGRYIFFYDWEVHEEDCGSEPLPVQVLVDTLPPTVVGGLSRCGPGQANLSATFLDRNLKWYDANGNYLASGPTFTTPYLTDSTDFLVQSVRYPAPQSVGPLDPSFGRNAYLSDPFDTHLTFEVFQSCRLKSFVVDAQGAGTREVILSDGQGQALDTLQVNLQNGSQRVEINLELEPGDYRLGGFNLDLKYNSADAAYPYALSGLLEINGSSGGLTEYYYFYDWEVQNTPCISDLTPIRVAVNPGPSARFTYTQTFNILQFTDEASGTTPDNWFWDFGDGSTAFVQNPSHTYQATGTYRVQLTTTDGDCDNRWDTTIVVDRIQSIEDGQFAGAWKLFPNPGNGSFQVSWEGTQPQPLSLMVYDMMGNKLWEKSWNRASAITESILLQGQPAGTYFLRLRQGSQTSVKKYLLMR